MYALRFIDVNFFVDSMEGSIFATSFKNLRIRRSTFLISSVVSFPYGVSITMHGTARRFRSGNKIPPGLMTKTTDASPLYNAGINNTFDLNISLCMEMASSGRVLFVGPFNNRCRKSIGKSCTVRVGN